MRRVVLLGALLALALGGTAQAKPWLSQHRARQAVAFDRLADHPPLVGHCSRETAKIVDCQVVDYVGVLGMYCYSIRQATLYVHEPADWVFPVHGGWVDAQQIVEAVCS